LLAWINIQGCDDAFESYPIETHNEILLALQHLDLLIVLQSDCQHLLGMLRDTVIDWGEVLFIVGNKKNCCCVKKRECTQDDNRNQSGMMA
jgi:hypothetical protein